MRVDKLADRDLFKKEKDSMNMIMRQRKTTNGTVRNKK